MEVNSENYIFYPECNMEITPPITMYKGPWLEFLIRKYRVNSGIEYHFEFVKRPNAKDINGATSVPILVNKETKERELILIANYRIPVENWNLEFPSGLTDDLNSGTENECLRELREETGYFGETSKLKNKLNNIIAYSDPHKSTENEAILLIDIDANLECNKNPVQDLDADEQIKVHKLRLDDNLLLSLNKLAIENNYSIAEEVLLFATGFVIGKRNY